MKAPAFYPARSSESFARPRGASFDTSLRRTVRLSTVPWNQTGGKDSENIRIEKTAVRNQTGCIRDATARRLEGKHRAKGSLADDPHADGPRMAWTARRSGQVTGLVAVRGMLREKRPASSFYGGKAGSRTADIDGGYHIREPWDPIETSEGSNKKKKKNEEGERIRLSCLILKCKRGSP